MNGNCLTTRALEDDEYLRNKVSFPVGAVSRSPTLASSPVVGQRDRFPAFSVKNGEFRHTFLNGLQFEVLPPNYGI
jgi:hypothetical protein